MLNLSKFLNSVVLVQHIPGPLLGQPLPWAWGHENDCHDDQGASLPGRMLEEMQEAGMWATLLKPYVSYSKPSPSQTQDHRETFPSPPRKTFLESRASWQALDWLSGAGCPTSPVSALPKRKQGPAARAVKTCCLTSDFETSCEKCLMIALEHLQAFSLQLLSLYAFILYFT